MPDENGTGKTRSDAPSVDDDLFGDAAAHKTAAAVDEQDSDAENAPEQQAAGDAGEKVAGNNEAKQDAQGSDDAEAEAEAASTDDLKVVLSIKGGRAVIGVQRPSADPHIETFDDLDETGLMTEVPAVIERARARWEDTPKHPAYVRPAPPVRHRGKRQRGATQDATAETKATGTEAPQQAPRLF